MFNCDVSDSKEHIGLRIKRMRAFRGMTQDSLARALGKSRSLVSFLERTGSVNPYTLHEICSILRTSPEELEPGVGTLQEEPPPDYRLLAAKDELIEQLREENRFLRETIHQQWNLFRTLEKGA
ncbi:MAG: helix-turn-helix domain-containing protein [Chitinophagia bacterium]|nr:helix-turn-helix domain-containing protein [Chitinophagia bacterium]